jgi:hypothetical protein
MIGPKLDQLFPERPDAGKDVVLAVQDLPTHTGPTPSASQCAREKSSDVAAIITGTNVQIDGGFTTV